MTIRQSLRPGVLLLCLSLSGCTTLVRPSSAYDRYVDALRSAGLHATALGRDWVLAGERALANPVLVALPFQETGYLPPDRPSAVAYRAELRRGRRLAVELTFESADAGRLFADLFEEAPGKPPEHVASLPVDATHLNYDVRRDGRYVLRLQPELLRGGRFTIVERTLSSLVFPVTGISARAVRSGFGAAREAGARDHEGIDIFAPRGTPAVAVVEGVAHPDLNPLGGNVVWLRDNARARRFYYAHLERWAIEDTTHVRPGEVLGYVGNTGNARTTSPHLHFGIYEGGPIDPLPFVEADDPMPPGPNAPMDRFGEWIRVAAARTVLRAGSHRAAITLRPLDRESVARVAGVSERTYRVELPDGAIGYVDADRTARADRPLRRARLTAGSAVLERPVLSSPAIELLDADRQGEVLGVFGAFLLVRLPPDEVGWIARSR